MAHGAPDHSRMSENAFAHYIDVNLRPPAVAIAHPLDPVPYTLMVDEKTPGVFGYLWCYADNTSFRLRMFIDDMVIPIMLIRVSDLRNMGFWSYSHPIGKIGLTRYDLDPADEEQRDGDFHMVYNERWGLYFHKELKIECQYSLAGEGVNASWHIHYKKLL